MIVGMIKGNVSDIVGGAVPCLGAWCSARSSAQGSGQRPWPWHHAVGHRHTPSSAPRVEQYADAVGPAGVWPPAVLAGDLSPAKGAVIDGRGVVAEGPDVGAGLVEEVLTRVVSFG